MSVSFVDENVFLSEREREKEREKKRKKVKMESYLLSVERRSYISNLKFPRATQTKQTFT